MGSDIVRLIRRYLRYVFFADTLQSRPYVVTSDVHGTQRKRPSHALLVASAGACVLGACSGVPTMLDPYEKTLGVDGPTQLQFHALVYSPNGTALHYPGYVVALEKSSQHLIGGPRVNLAARQFFHADAAYFQKEPPSRWDIDTASQIRRFQASDEKAMFISHIAKYSTLSLPVAGGSYTATEHCFVYNAYATNFLRQQHAAAEDLSRVNAWHACPIAENTDRDDIGTDQLYTEGRAALERLGENLSADLKGDRITHVILIVMGWNTAQDEAVRNFNDLTGNLLEAAYERTLVRSTAQIQRPTAPRNASTALQDFRPLVIGVTWPSFWSNSFTNVFSYTNKANDADEIGLSWLNELLNKTIPGALAEAHSSAQVVAIGHSFGARAMTRALFSAPALKPDMVQLHSPVRLAIGLEGAVSINRFVPSLSEEGAPYRDFRMLSSTQIALTASSHDKAAGGPIFWYDPSGSTNSFNLACPDSSLDYRGIFECVVASDRSASPGGDFRICLLSDSACRETLSGDSRAPARRVLYIDASNGITQFNTPGTGGGAHSDIYRLPMGRLLWRLIEQYAPGPANTMQAQP